MRGFSSGIAWLERQRWRWEAAALIVLVTALYGVRLTALPICGEEPRWACGAVQMWETGDWIVPRQQGNVFPERPPMSSWAMAIAALVRGAVDDMAVRLPSVLATVLTALVIYLYSQQFLSRGSAFLAAGMFATFGQVLQLGRMGESEALFTLFVSSSLLLWHSGCQRNWSPFLYWTLAYVLVALGALVKGIQAPVYFGCVTCVYLFFERRLRQWCSWSHVAGVAVGVTLVGIWQVPYLLATDWETVRATWFGLVKDRVGWQGLGRHLLSYPAETLVCLLPWSSLFLLALDREVRRALREMRPWMLFLGVSLAVTYPSVWWVAGARGRYYMPLYPCLAIVLGALVERAVQTAPGSVARRMLTHLARTFCIAAAVLAVIVAAALFLPGDIGSRLRQPVEFTVCFMAAACGAIAIVRWSARVADERHLRLAFAAAIGFVGLTYVGILLNVQSRDWNHPRPAVLAAKERLPDPEQLVSFGPVDHRFVYFYGHTIREAPWPDSPAELPPGITYFCFDRHLGDTPEVRLNGRGRQWSTTSGTLPFAWEEVAVVDCERRLRPRPHGVVVIGRILPQIVQQPSPEAAR